MIFTRHFRHYLLGRKFTIVTAHRTLQWLHNFKDPDEITARLLEKFAASDYDVRHHPGKSIGHADGLSRNPSSVNVVAETTNPSFPFEEHLRPEDSPAHQMHATDSSNSSDQRHIDSPTQRLKSKMKQSASTLKPLEISLIPKIPLATVCPLTSRCQPVLREKSVVTTLVLIQPGGVTLRTPFGPNVSLNPKDTSTIWSQNRSSIRNQLTQLCALPWKECDRMPSTISFAKSACLASDLVWTSSNWSKHDN